MKRQRNSQQIKEQDKCPPNQTQKQTLGEHKQNLICTQDPGERSHDPTRDWARLARECPRVSSEGVGQLWPAGKSETLNTIVLGAKASSINPFEGSWHCHHYPCHSLASGQTIRREHNPTINKKIELKVYWVWPHQSEQDPISPATSNSHQETSTKILCLSIRGHIEWKPQPQKSNQTYHMDQTCLNEIMSHDM